MICLRAKAQIWKSSEGTNSEANAKITTAAIAKTTGDRDKLGLAVIPLTGAVVSGEQAENIDGKIGPDKGTVTAVVDPGAECEYRRVIIRDRVGRDPAEEGVGTDRFLPDEVLGVLAFILDATEPLPVRVRPEPVILVAKWVRVRLAEWKRYSEEAATEECSPRPNQIIGAKLSSMTSQRLVSASQTTTRTTQKMTTTRPSTMTNLGGG